MFKSNKPPLCRYCGKPIKKWTISVYFDRPENKTGNYSIYRIESPKSLKETQRLFNEKVVSVRYHGEGNDRSVWTATLWDGESYEDEFFCNGEDAKRFAYVMARAGHRTKSHQNAVYVRDGQDLDRIAEEQAWANFDRKR